MWVATDLGGVSLGGYPDKVRLNKYYYENYSFIMDIEMIFATILGFKVKFAGEEI